MPSSFSAWGPSLRDPLEAGPFLTSKSRWIGTRERGLKGSDFIGQRESFTLSRKKLDYHPLSHQDGSVDAGVQWHAGALLLDGIVHLA